MLLVIDCLAFLTLGRATHVHRTHSGTHCSSSYAMHASTAYSAGPSQLALSSRKHCLLAVRCALALMA